MTQTLYAHMNKIKIIKNIKITSDGGQGPGNNGNNNASSKSHIEGQLHGICQAECFWLSLKCSVFMQVVSQTHAIGLVKEVQHFVIGSVLS
jgi:hypothetical protein